MAEEGDAKQTSGDLDFRLDPWIPGRHVGPGPDQLHGPRLDHGRSENSQDLARSPADLRGTASPRRSSRETRAQRHRWPRSRDSVGVRRQAPIASIALMDASMESLWLPTRQMASLLGIHRVTLQRLKTAGYFRRDHHFRKVNPLAPRSNTLWHAQRVQMRLGAE